jgi:hypothetical protein
MSHGSKNMRTRKAEQVCAERVSEAVNQLIHDPDAQLEQVEPADMELVATARQLARLPSQLGPVDPALERHVMRRVQAGTGRTRRMPRFKAGWAVAGAMAVLLLAMLFTPLGQTAVASFITVFNLGRTEVRITPADTPSIPQATVAAHDTAIRQNLTLEETQDQVSFDIPLPTYLPPGYTLRGVTTYTYPALPAWVPQPFLLDLIHENSSGCAFTLRLYPITLGDRANISGLNLEALPIQDVQDVDVNGQPGVFLQLGTERGEIMWQEVVWEQGDLILALSARDLTESDLMRVARSVR